MIRVNLLPYREQARLVKQKQFQQMAVLSFFVGIGLAVMIYMGINGQIDNQNSRNQFMQGQLDELNRKIESVKTFSEDKNKLLARKQKVEELQQERSKSAKLLDDLTNIMPAGVYLTSLEATKSGEYILRGKAVSDNRIAMFMNALPTTGIFASPVILEEIKKDGGDQSFRLKATLQSAASIEGSQQGGKSQ